jgi:hypothetical protein
MCPDHKDDYERPIEQAIWDRDGHLLRRFVLPKALGGTGNAKEDGEFYEVLLPDARTLAVFIGDTDIVFVETATGRQRGQLRHAWGSCDFSPDGTLLATNCAHPPSILFWDLARPLSGKAVLPAPKNAEQAERLWEVLGDPDPTESDRALWALVAVPEQTLPLLKERLRPLPAPDARRLPALIAQLDHDNFAEREAASQQLLRGGPAALLILRAARKAASAEQARRLDDVIAQLEARREQPAAILARLRELRALEVLERIGSTEARRLVEAVAAGHAADVLTCEARLILDRWHETTARP